MGDQARFDPRSVLPPRPALPAGAVPAKPAGPVEKAPKPMNDTRARVVRLVSWFGLMAAGVVSIVPMLLFAVQEMNTWALANASPAEARAALTGDWAQSNSPDYLEAVAEQSLRQPVVDEASAYVAAKRAASLDPSRAFAWAMLAYLETRHTDGKVNPEVVYGITKSMDACPLCDQELVRWRFNFVLAHWDQMPEEVRKRAFEQADLLRWIGPNAEFLAEMRIKAQLNGIPFDAYRAGVDTPARSWDIAPSAQLRRVQAPPA